MGEAKRSKASSAYPDTTKPRSFMTDARQYETVSWDVLDELALHPKSDAVIQFLEELKQKHEATGGNTMVVTLEGPARTPIIKIRVMGLGVFMGLIGGLEDLGLEDRLQQTSGPEFGIDAAFS